MAAGFLFKGVCYPSLATATSAHWSETPSAILPGTTSYITDTVWSGTAWVVKRYTLSSTGTLTLNSTTTAPTLTFETCNTQENFLDGLTLGWGVALAMVCAFAIRIQQRGF